MFHTWIFLPFFLIAYAVYLAVKRTKFKNLWILFASYVFYGWWNPLFLIIIAYSTVIDYIVVAIMEKCERRKKMLLAISIINNLSDITEGFSGADIKEISENSIRVYRKVFRIGYIKGQWTIG